MDTIEASVMTGKMTGVTAVNTNTVSNGFCGKMFNSGKTDLICSHCYSMKMLQGSRKNCVPKFQRNTDLMVHMIHPDNLPILNLAWLRGHGHGELINDWHYINFSNLARKNPHLNLSLFTKRRNIINRVFKLKGYKKPKNLILVYSNPLIDSVVDTPPKHFDKVFNTVTRVNAQDNCTGKKCIDCLNCYKHSGAQVLIEMVKKRS